MQELLPICILLCYLLFAYGHASSTDRLSNGRVYISAALNHPLPCTVCTLLATTLAAMVVERDMRRDTQMKTARAIMGIIVSILFITTTAVMMDINKDLHIRCATCLICCATVYMFIVAYSRSLLGKKLGSTLIACAIVWNTICWGDDTFSNTMTLMVELVLLGVMCRVVIV